MKDVNPCCRSRSSIRQTLAALRGEAGTLTALAVPGSARLQRAVRERSKRAPVLAVWFAPRPEAPREHSQVQLGRGLDGWGRSERGSGWEPVANEVDLIEFDGERTVKHLRAEHRGRLVDVHS